MVLLGLFLSAELEGIVSLSVPVNADWSLTVRCGSCNEINPAHVVVSPTESSSISGSRGEANLVMRCKFCKREGSINVVVPSSGPTAANWAEDQPLVVLECRGIDVTEWHAMDGWTVASESGKWSDVDLSEDWVEYDEKAGEPISISDVRTTVKRVAAGK
ncbi:hypothetical protein BC828DRAFT_388149 [Blastocladiella britannica]|nr:hypothetical protein BC828DRAFT_388149 [Blastocladiella britannica]